MSKNNAVSWFDIYVEDMDRAVEFYQKVFKQKLESISDPTDETQMMSFPGEMNANGSGGALVKSALSHPGVGGTMVYFNVEDCSIEESRVEEAGGKVVRPKFSIGRFGFVTLCIDTEGNIFGLSSIE